MAIQTKTAAEWLAAKTTVIPSGDTAYESDTYRRKIGNGTSTFEQLPYEALIMHRGDTAANWAAKNPVIGDRELILVRKQTERSVLKLAMAQRLIPSWLMPVAVGVRVVAAWILPGMLPPRL